jgi:hypothetical protein
MLLLAQGNVGLIRTVADSVLAGGGTVIRVRLLF